VADLFPQLFDDYHGEIFIWVIFPAKVGAAGFNERFVTVVEAEFLPDTFGQSQVNGGIQLFFRELGHDGPFSQKKVLIEKRNDLFDGAGKCLWLNCIDRLKHNVNIPLTRATASVTLKKFVSK